MLTTYKHRYAMSERRKGGQRQNDMMQLLLDLAKEGEGDDAISGDSDDDEDKNFEKDAKLHGITKYVG